MNAQEEWLIAHTFYCKGLSARITPEQCRINKEAAGRNEVWACKKCKEYKLIQKEALPMAISENVRTETIAALRSSQNQSQAAQKLKITQAGLYWRIMQDKEIHAVADKLGFLRKRAHVTALPSPKATGGGAMRKASNDNEKSYTPDPSSSMSTETHSEPGLSTKPPEDVKPENKELKNSSISENPPGIVVDPVAREVEISIKIHCALDKLPQVVDALNYLAV